MVDFFDLGSLGGKEEDCMEEVVFEKDLRGVRFGYWERVGILGMSKGKKLGNGGRDRK